MLLPIPGKAVNPAAARSSPDRTPASWRVLSGVLALTVVLLSGCSSRTPPAGESDATASAASSDNHDPCSLLDAKEVEAALGAPLATPPFRFSSGAPSDDGESCVYEDAHFHRILVDADWDGAAESWKLMGNVQSLVNQGQAKGMLHLADGSELTGSWDEARVQGCCTFATLLGDQGVTIDAEGSSVSIAAAAKLADAALQRLSKPLAVNGAHGVQAAKEYEAAHRPKHRDPCSLLSRSEAEAILGPLSGDPVATNDSCEYDRTIEGPLGKLHSAVVVSIDWNGGFAKLRQNIALRQGFAQGFASGLKAGKEQIQSALRGGDLPASPYWESAYAGGTVAGGPAAVKDDVMIGVDLLAVPADSGVKVLEKAMSKL
jgi:hypothetical protein